MEIVLALMKPELTLLLLLRNERKHLRNQQEDELLDQPLLQRKPHRPAEMNPTSSGQWDDVDRNSIRSFHAGKMG